MTITCYAGDRPDSPVRPTGIVEPAAAGEHTPMRNLTRSIALVVLALVAKPPAVGGQSSDASSAIDAYLTGLASQGQFSGTVLVARGPSVIFEKSYGKADFRVDGDNTPATLFAVASLTKPMTGIAARRLAESGALSLDDAIVKWLPEFPNAARITVADLLAHRSGIRHRVTQLPEEQQPQTAASMTQLVSRVPLAAEPRTQRLYSSAGYSVLARVLELASGQSYARLLRELVLTPAGAATAVDATEQLPPAARRATGHFWTHERPITAAEKQMSFLVGAGSLWATPRDLFRVARRVAEGAFGAAAAGARTANGAVQWTGFSNGFFASVDFNPATDVTLILTSNLLTGAVDLITRDMPRLLAGDTVAAPRVAIPAIVPLSAARRGQLEGPYDYFGNQQQLTFLGPAAALLGGEYILLATGDSSFFAPQNYADFTVVSDAAGTVTALRASGANGFSIPRVR
jgi:CubicO group peptidase (beta-lactamase class C family)